MMGPVDAAMREIVGTSAWAGPALILGAVIGIAVVVYLYVRIKKGHKL